MDAVILAAGLGTRLRPHTLTTPKPLLPVQGRPILDWTLGALPKQVDRVVVVVHYLAEQVEHYLGGQGHISEWTVVPQGEPRGTGDALRRCREAIRSPHFLVLNGDDLFGASDLMRLAESRCAVLVHAVDEPRRFGIVFRREDGSLERIEEKPNLQGRQMANTGAYSFPREVFDIELRQSPRGEYEITDYLSTLAGRGRVDVIEATYWFPIGTEEAWKRAEEEDLTAKLTRSN